MLSASQWCFGAFRLDAATICLWRQEQLVPLAPRPLAVLAYLVAHAGEVVTKDALLEAVWPETVVSEGVLKTCIGQIRQVLGETGRTPQYIATINRRGYRFIAPVTIVEPSASGPAALACALPLSVDSRPPAPPAGGAAALIVARDTELAQLHQCWVQALQGRRQIVCITGEAGIGKSTLVDAFVAQLVAAEAIRHYEWRHCPSSLLLLSDAAAVLWRPARERHDASTAEVSRASSQARPSYCMVARAA